MGDRTLQKRDALVSIIMPVYNRASVMGTAIDSCMNQSYKDIELIICDDHSTDGTEQYIRNRMKRDSRVKYCKNPKGKTGANAARNTAIRMAQGRYLAFLDSDDWLLENSISVRVKTFQENPKAALVYGNVYSEFRGRRKEWIYHDLQKEGICQKQFLMENLALCIQNSIMVRTDVFKTIGLLDEEQKAWTDDGLVVAVGLRYPLVHCGAFLAVNRKSAGSMISNKWNMYHGCKMMVHKYKFEIIQYASMQRYILWNIRLFSAYCYAKETNCDRKLPKRMWGMLHEGIRNTIKPYFKLYCE